MALSCSQKLSALLRGLASKHYGDFYSLNCLHSFRTKNKLEYHKRVCENKDFCKVIMPYRTNKTHNPYSSNKKEVTAINYKTYVLHITIYR